MFEGKDPYLVLVIIVVALAAFIIHGAFRSSENRKRRLEFEKALSSSRDDYAKAYASARSKLGERWNIIEIIHDLSPYSLGPAGLPAEITFEQAFEIVRQIRAAQGAPIAIVIHTMGGYSFPSDMIAKALVEHKGRKVTLVPYTAMSGGTLIALATEEVFMGSAAALGPIDTQYWGWPASAYTHLKQAKSLDKIDDSNIMRSYLAEKFEETAVSRAKSRINAKHRASVGDELTTGGRYHGDPISAEEAKKLGINVADKGCPKDAFTLVDAKLRMLALDLEHIVRRSLEVQKEQAVQKNWLGNHPV